MTNKIIVKDERTISVENTSFKFAYNFITYALLLDVIYRGLRFDEAAWDLLGIVIISGLVATIYQLRQKILDKSQIKTAAIILGITFVVASLLVFIIK